MKKRNIIFAAIILILGIVYLIADSKLYHYGKSKYNIFNYSLPLDMNPDYWGADVCYPIKGLTIEDEFGIVIIGKDEFYLFANDTITINKIIGGLILEMMEAEQLNLLWSGLTQC